MYIKSVLYLVESPLPRDVQLDCKRRRRGINQIVLIGRRAQQNRNTIIKQGMDFDSMFKKKLRIPFSASISRVLVWNELRHSSRHLPYLSRPLDVRHANLQAPHFLFVELLDTHGFQPSLRTQLGHHTQSLHLHPRMPSINALTTTYYGRVATYCVYKYYVYHYFTITVTMWNCFCYC